MKRIKKYLLISAALLVPMGLSAEHQAPFSPCSTDMQTVSSYQIVVRNDFPEAIKELSGCFDNTTQIRSVETTSTTETDDNKEEDNEMSHIIIQVNKKTLQHGEDVVIDISGNKPLKITLTGQVRTVLGYLIKNSNLLCEIKNPIIDNIASWTTSLVAKTYGLFKKNIDTKETYENHKKTILAKCAQVYRNTIGLLGGKCKIEVIIDTHKLRSDFAENVNEPTVVSFYRIIQQVIERMDEPDRFKYNGSMYNPVIQIV